MCRERRDPDREAEEPRVAADGPALPVRGQQRRRRGTQSGAG